MNDALRKAVAQELTESWGSDPIYGDEAEVVLPDGRIVHAKVVNDETPASYHINDADVWGKVSQYAYDYIREGHTPRPEGFDGLARKLQVDRGYWMWWQPFDGFTDLTPEEQHKEQEQVRWLLERGFLGVIVTLREVLKDSRGNPHWVEVASTSLWGIDSLENNYGTEVVSDLLSDLLHGIENDYDTGEVT